MSVRRVTSSYDLDSKLNVAYRKKGVKQEKYLDYFCFIVHNEASLPMHFIISFFLSLLFFTSPVIAQTTSQPIPTILKDVKIKAFDNPLINIKAELDELSLRMDAALFRANAITTSIESRADVLKTRGIKNSKLTRSIASVQSEMDNLKQAYESWKRAENTFMGSTNQEKDYPLFRAQSIALMNDLNKLTATQKSIGDLFVIYDKPSPTPKPSPTKKPTPTPFVSKGL